MGINNETDASTDDADPEDVIVQELQVRICDCPGPTSSAQWVCPIESDLCGIPSDTSTDPVGCYQFSVAQVIARNAWPLLFLWYFGLLVVLLCTIQGKTARDYIIARWCTTRRNNTFVDRLLRGELTNIDVPGFRWRFWTYNQRRFERGILAQAQYSWTVEARYNHNADSNANDGRKQTLELRTKRYSATTEQNQEPTIGTTSAPPPIAEQNDSSTNDNNTTAGADNDHDNESTDEPACSICFAPLEEGDRVGDLRCGHTFHVDCLKTWLPRRNTCPLCQAPGVARMRPMTDDEYARDQERERQLREEATSDSTRERQAISLSLLFPSIGPRRRATAAASAGGTGREEIVTPAPGSSSNEEGDINL
jgi:hypothetical protein